MKKYNLRWSGRRESGREWRASGRSATRGQTPALHSHHIVIITVLSSNCNHDSFLNHNGFVVISYSSRFLSSYCNHDSFCRIQVRSLPCLVSQSLHDCPPRCSLIANAGGRPFCHELGLGWVHIGQWIFSISALSHELFWRKSVFCVFTL